MELEKIKHSPINFSENIEITWGIFESNWNIFLKLILFIIVPSQIISMIPFSGILFIPFIISGFLSVASIFATSIIAENTIKNNTINLRKAVIRSANKLLIWLIVNFIASLISGVGFLFFIIPGIYFSTNFILIHQAIVLRNCGFNALDYSANLVKPNWWQVFGHIFLIGIIFMTLSLLMTIPFTLGLTLFDSFIITLISRVISGICSALVAYFFMVSLTVLFLNLEYVKAPNQNDYD